MTARNALNLGLLGLMIVLMVLVFVRPNQQQPPAGRALLDLDSAQVNSIRIERPNLDNIALQQQDGAWVMVTPWKAPANLPLIEQLLKITTVTCSLHYPATELELDRLQLASPNLRLTLNDRTLAFGGTETLNNRRYILSNGTVHLCADRHYYLLTVEAENFASPTTSTLE